MDWVTAWLLGVSCMTLVCFAYLIVKIREIERGAKAALQNVQLQLAFIAGRIGLRNQDLQASAVRETDEEPAPPPEVLGGNQWNDFDELIDRAQKGEIDLEEMRGAR